MTLAAIGMQELILALPLLVLWIVVLVWILRGKLGKTANIASLAAMALFTLGLLFSLRSSAPMNLAKNENLTIAPSSQRALIYNLARPCSLEVEVIELFGSNIEFHVLQDGKTIYESGVHQGRVSGTVAVAQGTVSVSVVNENLFDGKTVQMNVVALPR